MMSSEYKIKGRQRPKSAKPYERKTGIVKYVKDWLPGLPSWLNWNTTTTTDGSDNNNSVPSSTTSNTAISESRLPSTTTSSVPPQDSSTQHTNFRSSSSLHSLPSLQIKLPSILQNNTKHSPPLGTTSRRLFESTTLSVTGGSISGGATSQGASVTGGSSSKQERLNSSNDSERSWVAEDCEEVDILPRVSPRSRPLQLSSLGLSTPLSRTPLSMAENEIMEYEIGEGRLEIAPESSVVVSRAEHTVQCVANPAHLKMNSIRTPVNSIFSKRKVTLSASNLDRGLYSSHPLVTSTPQLSPVHEERRENMEQPEGPSIASQSQSQTSDSNFNGRQSTLNKSHSRTPIPGSTLSTFIKTPLSSSSKLSTEESIKRSPFHSPFYSGRTSFGGAASRQTPRNKRPRTESSPPSLVPMRLSITARSLSSDSRGGHHQLVASRTAKKILTTLETLNSPLSDARKLPMRTLPGEHQTSKRRRMSDIPSSAAGILSPPPVTPLHTPTYSTSRRPRSDNHTQIVPNERTTTHTSSTKQSPLQELVTLQKRNGSPQQSSSLSSRGGQPFTMPQFNTKEPPKQSSILAGLKFTPAPPTQPAGVQESPEKTPSTSPLKMSPLKMTAAVSPPLPVPGLSGFKPLFHGGASSGAGGGGKMRSAKRTHQHFHRETDDDVVVNPHAPPPSVGLSLGKDGSLPQFSFHTQLAKSKTLFLTTTTTSPALSSTPSTTGYSFSLPKAIESHPSLSLEAHQQKTTFDFSSPAAPLSSAHVPPKAPPSSSSIFSQPAVIIPSSHRSKHVPIKPPLNVGTQGGVRRVVDKQPPPLKNMSVEEALKKPEYQLPKMKLISQAKPPAQTTECIDLTDSGDEHTTTQKQTKSEKGSDGGLQLETGKTVLQLPPSGIQLGSKNSLLSSAAPLKALPQFAPPSNSWTCDSCMISNKAEDDKCMACSAKKSGSVKVASSSTILAPSIGLAGGLKLGRDLSLPNSNQSSKSDSQTLSQFAPPSGSWTCDTCMVSNKAGDDKCVACSASKPGSADKTISSSAVKTSTTICFGAAGGLKIGGSLLAMQDSKSSAQSLSKKFALPSGSWTCDSCMVSNKADDSKCVACSTSKPGSANAAKIPPTVTFGNTGGLKLGGSLLAAKTAQNSKPDSQLLSKFAPPSGSWTCDTCMVSNKAGDEKCVACSTSKPGSDSSAPSQLAPSSSATSSSGPPVLKQLPQFAPPAGSWSCDSCMISNKAEDTSCAACSAPKPGAKSDSTISNQATKPTGGLVLGGGGFKLGGGIKLGSGILGGTVQESKPLGGITLGSNLSLGGGGFKLGAGVSMGGGSSQLVAPAAQNTSGGLKLGSLVSLKGASEEKKISTQTNNNAQTKPISFGVQPPITKDTVTSAQPAALPPQFVLTSSASQVTQSTSSTLPQFNFSAGSSAASGFTLGNTSTVTASSGTSAPLPTLNPLSGTKNNPLAGIKLGGTLQSLSVPKLGTSPLTLGGQGFAPSTTSISQSILTGATTSSNSNNQGFQFSAALPAFGKTTTSSQMSTGSVPTFNFSAGKQANDGNSASGNSLFVFGKKDSKTSSPFPAAGSSGGLGVFGSGMGIAGSGGEQPKVNFGIAQQTTTASIFGSGLGQSSGNKDSSQPQGLVLDQQHTGTVFDPQPKKPLFGSPNLFGNQPQTQMQQQQQNTAAPMFNFHPAGSSGAPSFSSSSNNSGSIFGTDQASLKMSSSNNGAASSLSMTPQLGGSGSGLMLGANNTPSMFTQTATEKNSVSSSSGSFSFNRNTGVNLNFASKESGSGGAQVFTAGSQSTSTNRIIKKARRRNNAK